MQADRHEMPAEVAAGPANAEDELRALIAAGERLSVRHDTGFMEALARFADDEIAAASVSYGGSPALERAANYSLMNLCDMIDWFCDRRIREALATKQEGGVA